MTSDNEKISEKPKPQKKIPDVPPPRKQAVNTDKLIANLASFEKTKPDECIDIES